MNKKQEQIVNRIRDSFLEKMHGHTAPDFEMKTFEAKELDCGLISVVAESGLKGDEGTLAAIFCRNRIHVFVGKRGGITYYNKRGKNKVGKIDLLFSIYYYQNCEL